MIHVMDTVPVPGDAPSAFVLTAPVVLTITGLVIPLVTGLLTKFTLPSWVKGIITIVLNAVAAMVVTATQADGTAVISNATLLSAVYGVVVSVVSYVSVYKPAGLPSSAPDATLAPNAGLGKKDA